MDPASSYTFQEWSISYRHRPKYISAMLNGLNWLRIVCSDRVYILVILNTYVLVPASQVDTQTDRQSFSQSVRGLSTNK
jgi:hypothetical protein